MFDLEARVQKEAKKGSLSFYDYCIQNGKNDLLEDWNDEVSPKDISYGSHKKVRWKCTKCSYEWTTAVKDRLHNNCPCCSNHVVVVGINDLSTTYPSLLEEWNYEKNTDINPEDYSFGSGTKVWWKCKECSYEWKTRIVDRTSGNQGCPKCGKIQGGKQRSRNVAKVNGSVAEKLPELLEEWDYTKNEISPFEVGYASRNKVWWICKNCGNSWKASIHGRQHGNGCPKCNLYYQTSFAEQAIYYYLKQVYSDAVSRDMHIGMELDIYIPTINTAIEYDGESSHGDKWNNKVENDLKKNDLCIDLGINLIRIREPKCHQMGDSRIHIIYNKSSNLLRTLNDSIIELFDYLKLDSSMINVKRDEGIIHNSYRTDLQEKSLLALYPELMKDWDYNKNNIDPNKILPSSGQYAYWKCSKCGYEWHAMIKPRTNGVGCPACSNHAVYSGHNDLLTMNPILATDWNYEKNGDLKPSDVVYTLSKKVWWLCNKCGYEWKARVYSRNSGIGCPCCTNKVVVKGKNDLESRYSELVREWDYDHNDKLPSEYVYGSGQKVWWKCSTCSGEWQARIVSRTAQKEGCPYCLGRKVLIGYNDLLTTTPEVAKDWNYLKNSELLPSMVTKGSHKVVWWKCDKGHEYQMRIDTKYKSKKCPYCK